jgi:hypothetical protein
MRMAIMRRSSPPSQKRQAPPFSDPAFWASTIFHDPQINTHQRSYPYGLCHYEDESPIPLSAAILANKQGSKNFLEPFSIVPPPLLTGVENPLE